MEKNQIDKTILTDFLEDNAEEIKDPTKSTSQTWGGIFYPSDSLFPFYEDLFTEICYKLTQKYKRDLVFHISPLHTLDNEGYAVKKHYHFLFRADMPVRISCVEKWLHDWIKLYISELPKNRRYLNQPKKIKQLTRIGRMRFQKKLFSFKSYSNAFLYLVHYNHPEKQQFSGSIGAILSFPSGLDISEIKRKDTRLKGDEMLRCMTILDELALTGEYRNYTDLYRRLFYNELGTTYSRGEIDTLRLSARANQSHLDKLCFQSYQDASLKYKPK